MKEANEKLTGLSVASVKGTTTQQKVTKDRGVEVLHLLGNLTATASPGAQGPFTSVDSTMTITFTGAFPSDITKSVREEGATMTIVLKTSGKPNPEGPVVQMSGEAKRSTTRQFKLLN